MSAAKSTKDDVLCVRFKEVSASEVMKRVAETLNSSWKQVDGVYVLERTGDQNRADVRSEHKALVQGIAKMLAEKGAEASKYRPLNDSEMAQLASEYKLALRGYLPRVQSTHSAVNKLANRTPQAHVMQGVVAALDAEELSNLPVGIKVVYSTKPTAIQRPFPSNLGNICDEILSQGKKWQEAQLRANLHGITEGDLTYGIPGLTDNSSAEPNLAYLTILRTSVGSWEFGLHFIDQKGRETLGGSDLIGTDYGNVYFVMGQKRPDDTSFTIELDSEDKEILHTFFPSPNEPAMSSDLRRKMLAPAQFEPLSLLGSKWLLQIAEKKNENLVAYLPDDFVAPGLERDQVPTANGFLRFWKAIHNLTEADNWITLRPRRPARSRATRIDREFLGSYMQAMDSGRARSLEEDASFALKLDAVLSNPVLSTWCRALKIGGLHDLDGRQLHMLQFYGTLSSTDKLHAKSKEGLRLKGLSEDSLKYLLPSIYGPWPELRFEHPDRELPAAKEDEVKASLYAGSAYYQEPTVFLPDFPGDRCTLNLHDFTKVVAYTMLDNGRAGRSFEAQELGWQLFSQSRPDLFDWVKRNNYQIDSTHLAMGKRRDVTLAFRFGYGMRLIKNLVEVRPPRGPGIPLAQLPAEFVKVVKDTIEGSVKNYANAKPGDNQFGNQQVIPPL